LQRETVPARNCRLMVLAQNRHDEATTRLGSWSWTMRREDPIGNEVEGQHDIEAYGYKFCVLTVKGPASQILLAGALRGAVHTVTE